MTDLETRLSTMLHERAEHLDFDVDEWTSRLARPTRRRPRWAAAGVTAALAAAAVTTGVVVLNRATEPNTVAAAASARSADIVGTWVPDMIDGIASMVDPTNTASITFAENRLRVVAGCEEASAAYTRDKITGLIETGTWRVGQRSCLRPEIFALLRPGTSLIRDGNALFARDPAGHTFARLHLKDAPDWVVEEGGRGKYSVWQFDYATPVPLR